MLSTVADVAAALGSEADPDRCARLEELAIVLLRLGIVRWEVAQLRALLCRLSLESRTEGGDDDRRDAAAA